MNAEEASQIAKLIAFDCGDLSHLDSGAKVKVVKLSRQIVARGHGRTPTEPVETTGPF
jgi:hypothetical protein